MVAGWIRCLSQRCHSDPRSRKRTTGKNNGCTFRLHVQKNELSMPRNFLRAVVFDLGGTLMYERAAWDPIIAQADEALTTYLRAQGMELNLSSFPREFRKRIDRYFWKREKDLLETTYSFVLREVLADKGYHDFSEAILRNALDRLFAVTQTNWTLEEDTLSTLKKLEQDGYRLGLISNAGDDQDVQQL